MTADVIVFLFLTGVYILFGGLGNAVILTVYTRRKDSYNQHFFIKTLAALDLFICVVIIPYTIVYELHRVHNDVICRMMEIIRHIAILTGNSVLCAIAFERYVAICHPTKKLKQQTIRKIMVIMIIVTVAFSSPAPTIFTVTTFNIDGKTVEAHCQFTTQVIGILGTSIYQGSLALLCMSGILTVLVLYALIYRRLVQRVLRRRRSMSRPVTPNKYIVRKIKEGRDSGEEPTNDQCSNENEVVLCLVENGAILESKRSSQPFEKNSSESHTDCAIDEDRDNDDDRLNIKMMTTCGCQKSSVSKRKKQTLIRARVKPSVRRKTSIMLFVCSIIYIITWAPFWLDVFNVTHSLVLRYMFFIGHASNPVVYGIINNQVRSDVIKLFTRR